MKIHQINLPLLISCFLLFGCRSDTAKEGVSHNDGSTLEVSTTEPHEVILFVDLSTSIQPDEREVQRSRVHDFVRNIPVDWRITCYRICDDLFPEPLFPATLCDTRPFQQVEENMKTDYRSERADSLLAQLEPFLKPNKTATNDPVAPPPARPSCVTGALSALVQKPVGSFTKNTYAVFFADMLEECELAGVGAVNVNRAGKGEAYQKELVQRVASLYPPQGDLAQRLPHSNLAFVVTSNSLTPGRGIHSEGFFQFWETVLKQFGYKSNVRALMVGSGRDAALRFWPRK